MKPYLHQHLRFNLENEFGETSIVCELSNTNAREYIYLQSHEDFTLEEVKESMTKYLELLDLTQCQHLIIDTRGFVGEWDLLNDCLESELNHAKEKGLKYCAHIVPRDMARSVAMIEAKDSFSKNHISYEAFTGAATAVGWLEICDKV
ncbi:MAG: hypothetical protein H7Y04_06395 [Verrucomicrobia bacterium]|nr:hypothetical protein [Cytophagales bacterium]